MAEARRTPLYDLHRRLGARMIEFGGFAMPLQYRGIIEEHRAVRRCAGLFDLSHMGEFMVSGPRAIELLERALTNSAAALAVGHAHYTVMCADDGGTIDDLIVYRVEAERYLMCVNAANIAADREWLLALNRAIGAEFEDQSDATAMVAIQGRQAVAIAAGVAAPSLRAIGRFGVARSSIDGLAVIAARTGYTGEDGFEFFAAAADGPAIFERLLAAGQAHGLTPCGLGARDTLRLEAGLMLYGHELDRATTPIEAGLARFVSFGREFVGAQVLERQNREGPRKRLVGIVSEDRRSVPRQSYRLLRAGGEVGVVTSGSYAPSLERPVAMAYVYGEGRESQVGDRIEVEIRQRPVAAEVVRIPFYRRRAV
ncbi:MAG TPA: glycine cleavage system aminomethyltransferase GcvT [Candidatus Binataceae bacterium]|nr:glycine cleavage system aminomethyltransferase GcvT [Candidatus Binataceae bacterium]